METSAYHVTITFLTELLGSQSTREVASEFIAKRNGIELPDDEADTLPEALEKGTTVFHRDRDKPVVFDYQVKGFLKNAASIFNGKIKGPLGKEVRNLRQKVSDHVFVFPRKIAITIPEGEEIDYLERPLRAQTAQGPRVALARSEMLPAGSSIEFDLEVMPGELSEELLRELMDYGYYSGLGQWRGGGCGRFRYEMVRQ